MERMGSVRSRVTVIIAVCTALAICHGADSAFQMKGPSILLWPEGAPGSEGKTAPERWIKGSPPDAFHRLTDIHKPSISVYLPPKETATGAAFVVMPGGGHRYLVMDLEGEFVAEKLNRMGVAAFVLKSRLARAEGSTYKVEVESLADVRRAVRLVRYRSAEWGVDPRRVGVMGFSAGGHLVALAENRFDAGNPTAVDPVERRSSRPDFAVLAYPGMVSAATVTAKDIPPTFIFVNNDDPLSAASAEYYLALKKVSASVELHVFRRGGHGVGMTGRTAEFASMPEARWPDLLRDWMGDLGYLRTATVHAETSESRIRQELRTIANGPLIMDWQRRVGATTRPTQSSRFLVNDYGAKGDGETLDTKPIQSAIDTCAASGGGIVEFAAGRYVTGSLFIKSNVEFHIAENVELLGAENAEAFPFIHTRAAGVEMEWRAALLNVRGQHNVSITGRGRINGRGAKWWKMFWDAVPGYEKDGVRWAADYDISRPHLVQIYESSDVTFQGLTLQDSPFWTVHVVYSRNVTIDGLIIRNNVSGKGPSTDGINVDSSALVVVQNCDVDCTDDNYSFKAGMNADGLRVNLPAQYCMFRHNIARRGMGVITFGSDMSGSIRHVEVDGMHGIDTQAGIRFKSARIRGGIVENVLIHNVMLENVGTAIVADLNWFPQFSYPQLPPGRTEIPAVWRVLTTPVPAGRALPHFREITITDVRATGSKTGIRVAGIPDAPMERVALKRIHIEARKAGTIEAARDWQIDDVTIRGQDANPVIVRDSSNVPIT